MTDPAFSPTERSTIHRLPSRGSYDRKEIYDILDQGILAHVGFIPWSSPWATPGAGTRYCYTARRKAAF